ncbi:TPA: hypothetical protein SCR94_001723 [Enterobacter cloacae]|uniref:Uncharacterized protein n=1 Tax=Enterobacter cloacae TaxID=550 RepID=A0AAW6SBW1_ENTCL|nr:hypothetical protein [Enterobacter cloacae]AVL19376.1 hypothetical protein B2J95_15640 [Enterobacter cloacae]ELG6440503.1 hypothetical protein [Enterobacter cloacae]ELV2784357.1 hypothetical protein [Enterobacter cloacae]KTJ63270.1 hypothetical protein ASU78_07385 [Enterobacter cloacae subsp. cloacae]MCK1071994.1 hypothetical protein [Enterobacter cloacae subsp. cloacae]
MKIVSSSTASSLIWSDLDETLRRGVKTADPLSLNVLFTVDEIYQQHQALLDMHHESVGFIQFGTAFPLNTSEKIINDMAIKSRVSPVDFINANVGAPVSICCTRYRFQGPTMVLTMPQRTGKEIAMSLAREWLMQQATYLFLIQADHARENEIEITTQLVTQ